MNPSLAAVLIICTVFDATWCSFQLLLSLFTTKNDRVGPENSSTLPQFRIVLGIWSRSDAVQGTCRQDQRCRHPLDLKSPAPFRDIELATEHEKRTFGYESQEIVPEQQLRRDGSTRLRLLRNFAGVLLLSPTCMLVMSNYAVTTGLLDGCSHPELLPLGHQISLVPQSILRPPPLAFFLATVIWTLLEYVHYQSNVEDEYQKRILGVAVVLGLLPCVGCVSNALGVLICTTPWIVHVGLVVSGFLHNTGMIGQAQQL